MPSRSLDPELLGEDPIRWALCTRRATTRLARRFAAGLQLGDLLILSGDLGAGKTFFTRALCRALGLGIEHRVTSPTFTLVNELAARVPVIHADLYRIGHIDEVVQLGLREDRERCIMIVEWGVAYAAALGGSSLMLDLEVQEDRRVATLTGDREPLARLRAATV